jgi:hypothetical protein
MQIEKLTPGTYELQMLWTPYGNSLSFTAKYTGFFGIDRSVFVILHYY